MSERKLFGTDGIRGKANIYPMTSEIATALGRAVAHYFQGHTNRKKPLIIVGKDTRLSCYMFEQAFAAGVCSQGGEVILTGPLPTPGVAFVTESMRADAGVMISASHNHYSDNGIKIFDNKGRKLPDKVELKLEELVLNLDLMPVKVDGDLGNAKRLREVFGRYLVHVKSAIDNSCKMDQMRIVLDCANGAGYKVAPMMFDELGAEVITLGDTPNGQNINLNCGSLHPELAAEQVKAYRADLGVCLDGDADRVVIIDDEGGIVDGDALIGMFAKLLLDTGRLKKGDTIVGTVMSNLGLENFVISLGLKFHRTQVGDRYIVAYMRDNDCILGGEPSGHVIFGDHATTGDGCLASLKAIEAMKFYKKSIKELTAAVQLYPHVVKNIIVTEKVPLESIPSIAKAVKEIEEELGTKGRILLRYSGTEPLARVMVEGESITLVNKLCDKLVNLVQRELGK